MKIFRIIHFVALIFVIISVINLRNCSLIDWDEGVFALQAKWFASSGHEGKPFNFQTPPLFQMIIALFFKILGSKPWVLPFISIIFSFLTIYVIFFFARRLYGEPAALLAVILFITTEYFLFFAKSGLSDATFLFFFVSALYFYYRGFETEHIRYHLLCGVFTLLACYTKYTGPVLFLIFICMMIIKRKSVIGYRTLFTILLPVLAFIPFAILFVKVVTIQGIAQRHATLVGFNHLKFLFYFVRFAPVISILALFHKIKEQTDHFILTVIIVFFITLGLYHQYFRLGYPLIPFLSFFAAGTVKKMKQKKYYFLILMVVISIFLSRDTILYNSKIPAQIINKANEQRQRHDIKYTIAITPPNIVFYLNGNILIPESNIPSHILRNGYFKNPFVFNDEKNPILSQKNILLVFSSIFKDLKNDYLMLAQKAEYADSIEFIDAPVYYKDLFNPLRNEKQVYYLLVYRVEKLDTISLGQLLKLSIKPGTSIIVH